MTSVSQAVLSRALPAAFPPPLQRAALQILGLGEADRVYESLRGSTDPDSFLPRLLDVIQVRYTVTPSELKHVPRKGATVVVANHPFGILEAAVLVSVLREIRPDVRVLANEMLHVLPELQELVIPVDVLRGTCTTNVRALRVAARFLRAGGLLLVFPAGAVSHFQWREGSSVDPPWNSSVTRLVALARDAAPITVPVFVPGSNSPLFHAAGMLHPGLRTALLLRELFNKKCSTVELRIGRAIAYETLAAMPSDTERIDYLRWRTYLMAGRQSYKPNTRALRRIRPPASQPVIGPVPAARLAAEIERLPASCLLDRSGDLGVYLSNAAPMPSVMREIGRLREITFRQAGEGTGQALDLDSFDSHYFHLFLWNASKQEIAGAYRLQPVEQGCALYTRTLFHYDQRFLNAMGPALELGRSFVRAEYQRGFTPLLLLWKGIGKYLATHPRYKTLFGPVSISNNYQAAARELMIAFLEKRAAIPNWKGLVRPLHAPRRTQAAVPCRDVDDLSDALADLDPTQPGIPVLLRQYLKLGGKLLSFNVDPDFSSALDGLIVVDLTQTQPSLLERYLGKRESAQFLTFQKEHAHGTQ